MSEQPEALRLADALNEKPDSDGHCREAAAELRRLHEANRELLEALKLALESLEDARTFTGAWPAGAKAIAAIKEAMADQPAQQEPVAVYVGETWCGSVVSLYEELPLETPLYTSPPAQRKPLPAHEIVTMYDESPTSDSDMIAFARAIEAAHGIKGEA